MIVMTVARKPIEAPNIPVSCLQNGTGAINIDRCRIATEDEIVATHTQKKGAANSRVAFAANGEWEGFKTHQTDGQKLGRWPMNLILLQGEPVSDLDRQGGITTSSVRHPTGAPLFSTGGKAVEWNQNNMKDTVRRGFSDKGSVSRFFKRVSGR